MENVIMLKCFKQKVFLFRFFYEKVKKKNRIFLFQFKYGKVGEKKEERKFSHPADRLWFPHDFRRNISELIHLNSVNIKEKNLGATSFNFIPLETISFN